VKLKKFFNEGKGLYYITELLRISRPNAALPVTPTMQPDELTLEILGNETETPTVSRGVQ